MKSLILAFVLTTLFITMYAQESTKQSRKEEKKAEQIIKINNLIESKTFAFNAHRVIPMCGDAISLEYLYFVKVNNSTISSYLPFYGFESEYSIDNTPFDFTKTFYNYSNKKEQSKYVINFNVPVENDNFNYYFRITELGYTYLKITSTERQTISFMGIIDEIDPAIVLDNR
jgi:hypothetical protein